jgi:hypothetical protein
MEPTGWAAQLELIRHGAPHSGLRPDARSCRIEYVVRAHMHALPGMYIHGSAGAAGFRVIVTHPFHMSARESC